MPEHYLKVIILVSGIFVNGCATIVGGSNQTVEITSEPSGAKVLILPGDIEAITPMSIPLDRSFDYVIQFTKEGYEPTSARINRQVAGATLPNAYVPYIGIFGLATDSITDAEFQLHPDPLHIRLLPEGESVLVSNDLESEGPLEVIVFNSTSAGMSIVFGLSEVEKCELKKGEYATLELVRGTYALKLYHWDVFKFSDTYNIQIDDVARHIGVFPSIFSNHFSYYESIPEIESGTVEVACGLEPPIQPVQPWLAFEEFRGQFTHFPMPSA